MEIAVTTAKQLLRNSAISTEILAATHVEVTMENKLSAESNYCNCSPLKITLC